MLLVPTQYVPLAIGHEKLLVAELKTAELWALARAAEATTKAVETNVFMMDCDVYNERE